jgi:hypothetical protein
LTFSDVVKQLRTTFETFTDRRTGKNTTYSLTDAGLSAFSVFLVVPQIDIQGRAG